MSEPNLCYYDIDFDTDRDGEDVYGTLSIIPADWRENIDMFIDLNPSENQNVAYDNTPVGAAMREYSFKSDQSDICAAFGFIGQWEFDSGRTDADYKLIIEPIIDFEDLFNFLKSKGLTCVKNPEEIQEWKTTVYNRLTDLTRESDERV